MTMHYLPLLDLDKTFSETPDAQIIPCGTESLISKKQVEEFMRFVFSNGDLKIDMGATCECGMSKGMYLLGQKCPYCKTIVDRPMSTELSYQSWVQIPEFLPPMLQPAAFRILESWMGRVAGEPLLMRLMQVGSELPPDISAFYTPGMWSFYNQFDKLIEFLSTQYTPLRYNPDLKSTNEKTPDILAFIKKYRNCLFARHFPILDQSMHIINTQGTMSFIDSSSSHVMKMIMELANIHYMYDESKNINYIEQCAVDMIRSYYDYSDEILTTKLTKKPGLIRHHILGSRCHFTFRGVIVPITDAAYGDELYMPWGIGVQQHKLEIFNLLVNRKGKSPHEAQLIYASSMHNYNEEVHEILNTLIDECPYKGLPCLFGRNPSLVHGALGLFFVTKFKNDVTDDCISMPPQCVHACNADFDNMTLVFVSL